MTRPEVQRIVDELRDAGARSPPPTTTVPFASKREVRDALAARG